MMAACDPDMTETIYDGMVRQEDREWAERCARRAARRDSWRKQLLAILRGYGCLAGRSIDPTT